MEPLQSIEEAAQTLGLSPWTVRRWVSLGRIMPVRLGRRVLIEQQEIARLVESGRHKAKPGEGKERNHDVC